METTEVAAPWEIPFRLAPTAVTISCSELSKWRNQQVEAGHEKRSLFTPISDIEDAIVKDAPATINVLSGGCG